MFHSMSTDACRRARDEAEELLGGEVLGTME